MKAIRDHVENNAGIVTKPVLDAQKAKAVCPLCRIAGNTIFMKPADEKRIAAKLAKLMGLMCVRNTRIEAIHTGVTPITKTGDYSDVVVLDANGREIPWAEVSHFDDDAMRDLMRQIVNRLYTFQLKADDPAFHDQIERWASVAEKWDEPELDERFLRGIAKPEGGIES